VTGSFRDIDYRLRPAKHAERLMLVELFRSFRLTKPIDDYHYTGMGSVAFVDHRLMHRHLGIKKMVSIEDVSEDKPTERERFSRNCPLSCISLHFSHSNVALSKIEHRQESIVWLDYDGKLGRSMATDLSLLSKDLPAGSFVAVTFRGGFPSVHAERTSELLRLRNEFPEFVEDSAKPIEFENLGLSELGRRALGELFQRSLADQDALLQMGDRRRLKQLCYFRYRDGAVMATIGWLITNDAVDKLLPTCNFEKLVFFRDGSNPFKIRIPLITPYEIQIMERGLPSDLSDGNYDWIPLADRTDFLNIYRYLPTFGILENI